MQGNLLDAKVDAVVNTVNTVGVMGKGIALMFKERYGENFRAYAAACRRKEVVIGKMFVTGSAELTGPRWIINFPTKEHWRNPSRLEWVEEGLVDLRQVIVDRGIKSIAIPPLGSGNGGLDWSLVRPRIETVLGDLEDVEIWLYEPTARYPNPAKDRGVEKLTPARALITEMIRRYGMLGLDCSILEVQKLAWFLSRMIVRRGLPDPLKLQFTANRYGPFTNQLMHLLNDLDGSFLHCEKRLADASPFDTITFDAGWQERLATYFQEGEGSAYGEVVAETDALIDGFQSPLGMEALATLDWLVTREKAVPTLAGIREALGRWPVGEGAAERKQRLFSDKLIEIALQRLARYLPNP